MAYDSFSRGYETGARVDLARKNSREIERNNRLVARETQLKNRIEAQQKQSQMELEAFKQDLMPNGEGGWKTREGTERNLNDLVAKDVIKKLEQIQATSSRNSMVSALERIIDGEDVSRINNNLFNDPETKKLLESIDAFEFASVDIKGDRDALIRRGIPLNIIDDPDKNHLIGQNHLKVRTSKGWKILPLKDLIALTGSQPQLSQQTWTTTFDAFAAYKAASKGVRPTETAQN